MKNLSFKICLVIAALFGGVGSVSASDLPPCPSSGYFHNCFGTYSWYDGDKYVGEWKDDKKNGQGTYISANGEKYIGELKNGKLNGYAIRYSSDGSILKEGIWKDDKFIGK